MKILTYSPSIEAYVETTGRGGEKSYHDISPDITKARIVRNSDAYSTFSITLQNRNGKYNGVFTPMDRIAIYLTKTERHRVFTGYLNTVTSFTLYQSDFEMSGRCSIYQTSLMYWDPSLTGSYSAFAEERTSDVLRSGYGRLIAKLLVNVGGWKAESLKIGEVPQGIIDWAYAMYEANASDIGQIEGMVDEFYAMLRESGPALSGQSGGQATAGAASDANVENAVQWMLNVANDDSHGYSMPRRTFSPDIDCSSFIYYALLNNGWTQDQLGGSYPFVTWTMEGILSKCGWKGHSFDGDVSKLRRGDIMLNPSSHTEMYIGGGKTVGAHMDYDGAPGDSSGNEVSVVEIASGWQRYLRYEGAA